MKLRVYGLTGGIACGKSTVSRMFHALRVPIIDADRLARAAVEKGNPIHDRVRARFPQVFDSEGCMDRQALGRVVFKDKQALSDLNAIMHPRIEEMVHETIAVWRDMGEPLVIYDNALIFELGHEAWLDGVIVVSAPEEVQLHRLCARNQLPEDDARSRIAAQLPLSEKARRATYIIDNGGTEEATLAAVTSLYGRLIEEGRDRSG